MRKHQVTIINQQSGGSKNITVEIYESFAEAVKSLGEQGVLQIVNDSLISDARAAEHRKGQLATAKRRRLLAAAALEFAKKHGFDETKVKVS